MIKYFRVKNIQFRISECEHYTRIHFEGTNELKDVIRWPWPTLRAIDGFNSIVRTLYKQNINAIDSIIIQNVKENKRVIISGFSWGCCIAHQYAIAQPIQRMVYLELDDPPRILRQSIWLQPNVLGKIYLKGYSIVHSLPPKLLGYFHADGINCKTYIIKTKWTPLSFIKDHLVKVPHELRFVDSF